MPTRYGIDNDPAHNVSVIEIDQTTRCRVKLMNAFSIEWAEQDWKRAHTIDCGGVRGERAGGDAFTTRIGASGGCTPDR
ncbi:hypothetical protein [Rhodococcus koreensis]|uniref:hypothetical protein n=1 Tax=Rhodococcus koreensis TaxID=99653 RepID=UPI003672DC84